MDTGPPMASTAAKAIQKIRLRILPFVLLLFVVALIDRNNAGFAALTMNKELAITSQQFGLLFGDFRCRLLYI
jgi:ACS family tartrate transporter-like MFS transporter